MMRKKTSYLATYIAKEHGQMETTKSYFVQGHLEGVICLLTSESAIQTQSDEHEEEDDGPEDGPCHRRYGFRVDYEDQAWSFQAYFFNALILYVRHVSKQNEN